MCEVSVVLKDFKGAVRDLSPPDVAYQVISYSLEGCQALPGLLCGHVTATAVLLTCPLPRAAV